MAAAAQQEAAKRGLLLLTCGAWGQVVRFIPALVVGEQDVEEAAQIWSDAVGAVLGEVEAGLPGGSPARSPGARQARARRSCSARASGVPGTWVPRIEQPLVSIIVNRAISPMMHAAIM